MLGFAPIAAAPFGAAGDAGAFFDVSFEDAAEASSNLVALAVFPAEIPLESAAGQDSVLVAPSTFGSNLIAGAEGDDATSVLVDFAPNIQEGAVGVD
jgi:hypothetical protein